MLGSGFGSGVGSVVGAAVGFGSGVGSAVGFGSGVGSAVGFGFDSMTRLALPRIWPSSTMTLEPSAAVGASAVRRTRAPSSRPSVATPGSLMDQLASPAGRHSSSTVAGSLSWPKGDASPPGTGQSKAARRAVSPTTSLRRLGWDWMKMSRTGVGCAVGSALGFWAGSSLAIGPGEGSDCWLPTSCEGAGEASWATAAPDQTTVLMRSEAWKKASSDRARSWRRRRAFMRSTSPWTRGRLARTEWRRGEQSSVRLHPRDGLVKDESDIRPGEDGRHGLVGGHDVGAVPGGG